MGDAPRQIHCYDCGTKQLSDRGLCIKCQAQFRRLCRCGCETSVYIRECPDCGRALRSGRPKRPPSAKLLIRGGALLLVFGAAAAAWKWFPRDFGGGADPGARAAALALYRNGEFTTAQRALEALGDALDDDADALAALGHCRQRNGGDVATPLRKSLEVDPRQEAARLLLTDVYAGQGRHDLAAEVMEAAQGRLSVAVLRRAADEALHEIQPDVERALTRLEEAIERDEATLAALDATLRLQVRCHGLALPELLPARIRRTVDALARLTQERSDPSPAEAAARARLHLVRGRPGDAEAEVEQALAGDGVDAGTRASLLLLRGRARLERGRVGEATESFLDAIALRPDAATAQRAVDHLVQSGGGSAALALLRGAAERSDANGAVHAVLAAHELAAGDTAAAGAAVDAALGKSPGNAFFLRVRGDVETAGGDVEGAAASYAAAVEATPGLLRPRLRAAVLSAARDGYDAAFAALADLADLRYADAEDDRVLVEIGALHLERDQADEAVAALEEAGRRFAGRVRTWVLLARASLRSRRANGVESAAMAIARARRLRPGDGSLAAEEVRVRIGTGDVSAAALLCSQMIEGGHGSPELLRLRARAFVALERWSRAAKDLRAVLQADPDSGGDYLALVDVEFRAGNVDAAQKLIDSPPPSLEGAGRELLELVRELHAQ